MIREDRCRRTGRMQSIHGLTLPRNSLAIPPHFLRDLRLMTHEIRRKRDIVREKNGAVRFARANRSVSLPGGVSAAATPRVRNVPARRSTSPSFLRYRRDDARRRSADYRTSWAFDIDCHAGSTRHIVRYNFGNRGTSDSPSEPPSSLGESNACSHEWRGTIG